MPAALTPAQLAYLGQVAYAAEDEAYRNAHRQAGLGTEPGPRWDQLRPWEQEIRTAVARAIWNELVAWDRVR